MGQPAANQQPNSEAKTAKAVVSTDLSLPARRGKVRDVYRLPPLEGDQGDLHPGQILMVASDRLSAFDVVLPTPIPGKGCLLTEIAAFWLRWIEDAGLCRTHLISIDARDVPDSAFAGQTTRSDLVGRVTIGRACEVIPIECVVRGYIEGSGWSDYQRTGAICGVELPPGLERCAKLPEPIFTPATKAEDGEHDENISAAEASSVLGADRVAWLERTSIEIYKAASAYALERGIIIADTKFEFGVPVDDPDGEPILIDEALTPDSSRFWPADAYAPGQPQQSFDKQFVREHLESLVASGAWDKTAPGPELPSDVVLGTLSRYREARDRLMA